MSIKIQIKVYILNNKSIYNEIYITEKNLHLDYTLQSPKMDSKKKM